MRLKFILFLLVLCFSFKGFSCDCMIRKLKETRKFESEFSDVVFLGEVISVDNSTYKFKILEVFKGLENTKVLEGELFTSCSFTPQIGKGPWLVYANLVNGKLDISQCGVSRSYSEPYLIMTKSYTPPSPGLNENEYQEHISKLINKGQKDWRKEVNILRNKKTKLGSP